MLHNAIEYFHLNFQPKHQYDMDRKIFAHELKRAGHKSSLSLLVVRYYPSEMELRSVEKIKVMD
ncbi:hypothetical protein T03_7687 [Trichinella britovi]|uniref:Uncharacterized protein n=1 Tax=Trichinella britovi TaxID=45882 RepID=A0A0V1CUT7_TRIBR|nr:hypothetical protein T03_7687 [Trichinella britovi]